MEDWKGKNGVSAIDQETERKAARWLDLVLIVSVLIARIYMICWYPKPTGNVAN